jgi:hypothetical protein
MKKYIIAVFLIVPFFLLCSCSGKNCPGFDTKFGGWVPYDKGDVLTFRSGTDEITFEIDSVFITKPYYHEFEFEGGCMAEYSFSSKKNKLPYLYGKCGSAGNCATGVSYYIDFPDDFRSYTYFSYPWKKGCNNYSDRQYIKDTVDYQINDQTLYNVLLMECWKKSSPEDSYMYIHNGKGLVGFIDRNGKEYKLVE